MARRGRTQAIARDRIHLLMDAAEEAALRGDLDRADRYARLARRVGMRYNVPMPRELKPFLCRSCGAYLLPGTTSRVRTRDRKVTTTCLRCGGRRRVPVREEVG